MTFPIIIPNDVSNTPIIPEELSEALANATPTALKITLIVILITKIIKLFFELRKKKEE